MSTFSEPGRELPCSDRFDVVVIGGGIAGCSAALAARRAGAEVAVIEKTCGLGGLATLGNVVVYLPLCDGHGRQVIGGLGEELLAASLHGVIPGEQTMGIVDVPGCWREDGTIEARTKKRLRAVFNPVAFQIELEHLLRAEGVEIFYDTRLCSCATESDRVTHVVIENKSGRLALQAPTFVDSSGDADLCFLAGERTVSEDSNVLAGWYFLVEPDGVKRVVLSKRYAKDMRDKLADQGPWFRGDVGKDVSEHVLQTRAMLRERLEAKRAEEPDVYHQPIELATIPGFRATRRLETDLTLTTDHLHTWFDDAIGMTGDWRAKGPIYALPLRSIRAERHPNLFAAGRCIAATGDSWDVTRAIGPCAVTGEAAGAAAAIIATKHGGDHAKLTVEELQAHLRSKGAIIDEGLVAPAPEADPNPVMLTGGG